MREGSRWVPVAWHELPGLHADQLQAAWPALLSSCQRPPPAWTKLCAKAQQSPPRGDAQIRDWLKRNLQPYRVESLEGAASGLITGYYEPLIEARRAPGGAFRVALYAAAGRSRDASAVLDAPATRHAAGGAGVTARTRDRLCR